MKGLRTRFERFCLKHRDWGIPNLMLYISIGSAIVYLLLMINGGGALYNALCFNKQLILQGQVWRLVTYVFTYSVGNPLFVLIGLFCYYSLGRALENAWGTFRFNLFYFSGVVLMDIFAMIFSTPYYAPLYVDMVYYLNLSLVLAFATMYPDAQFMIMFVIPIKAKVLCIVYLALNLIDIFNMSYPVFMFPHNLFPLVALANYFLFTGKNVMNLLPVSWQIKAARKRRKPTQEAPKVIHFRTEKQDYSHRCTVCGRTDVTNPELEFRYCSRCSGYHCYCQDHINHHEHVQ